MDTCLPTAQHSSLWCRNPRSSQLRHGWNPEVFHSSFCHEAITAATFINRPQSVLWKGTDKIKVRVYVSLSWLLSTKQQCRKQQHLETYSCNHCFLISSAGHKGGHNNFPVLAALCFSPVLFVSGKTSTRPSLDGTSLPCRYWEPTFLLHYLSHRCTAGTQQCLEVNSVKSRSRCPVLDPDLYPHVKAVPPPSRTQVPPMMSSQRTRCCWRTVTCRQGQLGAGHTPEWHHLRLLSEQGQGIVLTSIRLFRCARKHFWPRLHQPSLYLELLLTQRVPPLQHIHSLG